VQAKVFELAYDDGRPTGKVLKIGHTGATGLPVSGQPLRS
jgi:hypothetical protein